MIEKIVVVGRTRVYGPFQDANEAFQWVQHATPNMASVELPLVIQTLVPIVRAPSGMAATPSWAIARSR